MLCHIISLQCCERRKLGPSLTFLLANQHHSRSSGLIYPLTATIINKGPERGRDLFKVTQ